MALRFRIRESNIKRASSRLIADNVTINCCKGSNCLMAFSAPQSDSRGGSIHSKKVCGTAFSVKKKYGKSAGHFGSLRGVILGPFRIIFGPLWVIFVPFCGIFGQICGKFKFFCGIIYPAILAFRMYVAEYSPSVRFLDLTISWQSCPV